MKAWFILSASGVLWFLAGAIAAACFGSFFWGMVFALLTLMCLFVASREWDALKVDEEWKRMNDPRLNLKI